MLTPQGRQNGLVIIIQRRGHSQPLARIWMHKYQGTGMQTKATTTDFSQQRLPFGNPVFVIPQQRKAAKLAMHPDLVGAPGFQRASTNCA